jgi:hypothetical protein
MPIILEANYSKKLGLPGYSSHQYMLTLRTELGDVTQVTRGGGSYCLVDDAVKLLQHVAYVGCVSTFLQFLVNRLDVVVTLGVGVRRRLHDQRFEADENLPRQNLEPAPALVTRVDDGVSTVGDGFDACEAFGTAQTRRVEAQCRKAVRVGATKRRLGTD